MLNTLVFFTYLDIRARLSISDLRLSSDRKTILIGRLPHLAMIPSSGEVSIRMNIIFTPMNHLKQLSQYEWFVSRTETPFRKCRKIWTRFPSSEMRKRVVHIMVLAQAFLQTFCWQGSIDLQHMSRKMGILQSNIDRWKIKLRLHDQSFCATFRTPCSLCCQISVGL